MVKTPSKRLAWWLPLLSAVCISAQAHTPYLLPTSFEASPRAVISVDASFADKFFIPEVAFGETRFTVTAPDGSVTPMADVRQFKTRTVAEHQLPDEKGTYRVSTGPRLGAVFRSWERNGKVETARDPATPTPAATMRHMASKFDSWMRSRSVWPSLWRRPTCLTGSWRACPMRCWPMLGVSCRAGGSTRMAPKAT